MPRLLALIVCLFPVAAGLARAQEIPVGYQEYIVLGRDGQVFDFMAFVAGSEGSPLTETHSESVVTLTASLDEQAVYYDHWEDGFEQEILDPQQASTEVYLLDRGQVLLLASNLGIGGINGVIPLPRNPADIRYDGGDRVVSVGGPVDLAHSMWPYANTYIGGAWEMYARQALAGSFTYRIPVGVDSYDGPAGEFAPFKYVEIQVTAFEDQSWVVIDNGVEQLEVGLDRGQSYSSQGSLDEQEYDSIQILANTLVSSNKDIQVGILTGSNGTFQTRFYNAIPLRAYGRDYVLPVRGSEWSLVNVYLFNPNATEALVSVYDQDHPDGVSFVLAPTSAGSLLDAGGTPLPAGSGGRIVSDQIIWGLVAYDYTDSAYDWGFSLVPSRFLKMDYFVSWSPAHRNPAAYQVGSPVWVTPTRDGTTVWVDLDGDSVFDDVDTDGDAQVESGPYLVDVLDVLRIYDPHDGDNTGTRVVADGPVALSYGADADVAGEGLPYLDLGYTVLPITQDFLLPILRVTGTPVANTVHFLGGDLDIAILVQAGNYDGITGVDGLLEMSSQIEYLPGSTRVTLPGGQTLAVEPADVLSGELRTLRWEIDQPLQAGQEVLIELTVRWDGSEPDQVFFFEAGATGDYLGMDLNPRDRFPVTKTYFVVEKLVDLETATAGSLVTYTLSCQNLSSTSGDVVWNLVLRDPLHEGLDFLSADTGGSYQPDTRTVVWSLPSLMPGQSFQVSFQAQVKTLPTGFWLENTAYAFTDNLPRVDSNPVGTRIDYPELALVKQADLLGVMPLEPITYTLGIKNLGELDAHDAVVVDQLPPDTTYLPGSMTLDTGAGPEIQTDEQDTDACEFSAGRVTARFPLLPAGAEHILSFQTRVNDGTPTGAAVSNLAVIQSAGTVAAYSNVVVVYVGTDDPDQDGLSNQEELDLGTDPSDADSDDDGISDGEEVIAGDDGEITNPLAADSDNDGLCDGTETGAQEPVFDPDGNGPLGGTRPGVFIPDQDPDTTTDPNLPDSDADELPDGLEDRDHDGLVDPGETDPNLPDSDQDGLADGIEDANHNGIIDPGETNPVDPDSDDDGLIDGADICPLHPNPLQDLQIDAHNCGSCGNDCADGLVCNGAEVCQAGACQAVPPLDCDDGIDCTVDSCQESQSGCVHLPDHAVCDDGLWCTGEEICDAQSGCRDGPDPCPGQLCREETRTCLDCLSDSDCDDGLYCNGQELCNTQNGVCRTGQDPCYDGVSCTIDGCHELTQSCENTPDDSLCDDWDECTLDVCYMLDDCQHEFIDTDEDGVCDAQDTCPEDPRDRCHDCLDSDGDLFCDDVDPCPHDPDDKCDDEPPPGDGGCACRAVGGDPMGVWTLALLAGLLGMVRRRKSAR